MQLKTVECVDSKGNACLLNECDLEAKLKEGYKLKKAKAEKKADKPKADKPKKKPSRKKKAKS